MIQQDPSFTPLRFALARWPFKSILLPQVSSVQMHLSPYGDDTPALWTHSLRFYSLNLVYLFTPDYAITYPDRPGHLEPNEVSCPAWTQPVLKQTRRQGKIIPRRPPVELAGDPAGHVSTAGPAKSAVMSLTGEAPARTAFSIASVALLQGGHQSSGCPSRCRKPSVC